MEDKELVKATRNSDASVPFHIGGTSKANQTIHTAAFSQVYVPAQRL